MLTNRLLFHRKTKLYKVQIKNYKNKCSRILPYILTISKRQIVKNMLIEQILYSVNNLFENQNFCIQCTKNFITDFDF